MSEIKKPVINDNGMYGTLSSSSNVKNFIKHCIDVNEYNMGNNKPKTPICIWGRHGIGKTDLVKQICKEMGYDFKYVAPAQFEEMGDFLGMPTVERDGDNNEKTLYAKPDWVPDTEGKGILLIDDFNRADDRILRGCMQLLQNYETMSWKLPKGWDIVLTANPENGDYSVSDMDGAMLTRMRHISMQFDKSDWAKWAFDNEIDDRGIDFVLLYPEILEDNKNTRATPRSFVQFFDSIKNIKDLSANKELVKMLAESSLDKDTTQSFLSYMEERMNIMIEVEDIFNKFDSKLEKKAKEIFVDKKTNIQRLDIINVIIHRICRYIDKNVNSITSEQIKNISNFLAMDVIPADIVLTVNRTAANYYDKNPVYTKILENKAVREKIC